MHFLTQDFPDKLLHHHDKPCISLYQSTHCCYPENKQDSIRFKNLTKKIEHSLLEKYKKREVKSILNSLHDLEKNHDFWNHTRNGLAVLATPNFFWVYKCAKSFPELAIVAESFHIKPLIRIIQSTQKYQILALTREHITLYEGTRDDLLKVTLSDEVPDTLVKALGGELTAPHLTVSSYGKGSAGPSILQSKGGGKSISHPIDATYGGGAQKQPMRHGQGGRKDEIDLDMERFFKRVDEAITKHHSQQTKLPLILAALPEYHGIFHQISNNPYLHDEGIKGNPDELSMDALRKRGWSIIEPQFFAHVDLQIDHFQQAKARNIGSEDLIEIAKSAVIGRVATLLIEEERQIPGKLDLNSGEIQYDELLNPKIDDLLDDIAELVLKKQGEVLVISAEKMPADSGIAAIYRY